MAKILQGLGVEHISGTIGGTTFQNWRGMIIARGKPTPSNPNTPRQSKIRSIITELAQRWRNVLTEGLRTAWNQYADRYPWIDVFGREIRLSGINLYIKVNTVLYDHKAIFQDTPPPEGLQPPELADAEGVVSQEDYIIRINNLPQAIITDQEPFIDIWVAGGSTRVEYENPSPDNFRVAVYSQCLPQGRTPQKSDYRHVYYVDDMVYNEANPEKSVIEISPPDGTTKKVAVILRRYNKFGNFSAPRVFEGVVSGAPL